MPEISIIVPVYNVEPYLRKCIDSIIAQTFTDFECILIDDGSTDNCPAICDEYAGKDNRIVVIHQKNAGVSAARNAGLDIARGEWIGFVDSDDWCDPKMFEFLLGNAEKHQADISICGVRSITEENKTVNMPKKHFILVMNSRDAVMKLCVNKYINALNCNKLVKKQLFLYNGETLRYDEKIKCAEDRLMFFFLFKRAQRIVYSPQVYYNYYRRTDSVSMIQKVKGLTEASITGFDAHEKMLSLETDRKIRRGILASKGIYATLSCLRYIKNNGFIYDNNYYFLRDIVKKNICFILLLGSTKQRMHSCLVFFPFVYQFYRKIKYGKT